MFVTPSVCSWCPSVTIAVMSEAPATLALPVAETAPPSGENSIVSRWSGGNWPTCRRYEHALVYHRAGHLEPEPLAPRQVHQAVSQVRHSHPVLRTPCNATPRTQQSIRLFPEARSRRTEEAEVVELVQQVVARCRDGGRRPGTKHGQRGHDHQDDACTPHRSI